MVYGVKHNKTIIATYDSDYDLYCVHPDFRRQGIATALHLLCGANKMSVATTYEGGRFLKSLGIKYIDDSKHMTAKHKDVALEQWLSNYVEPDTVIPLSMLFTLSKTITAA